MFVCLFVIIFTFVAAVTMDMNLRGADEAVPVWSEVSGTPASSMVEYTDDERPHYCVAGNGAAYQIAVKALDYVKKPYITRSTVLEIDTAAKYSCVIVAEASISADGINAIKTLLEMGTPVVFAQMPDEASLSNQQLREILGIEAVGRETEQEGFHVIDGFLLGGRKTYETIKTTAREVSLSAACKTYIRANDTEADITNEEQNVLLWRTYQYDTPVFVFNNSFMSDDEGIGCLISVLSFTRDVYVYPIVSSFAVTLTNFPLDSRFDTQSRQIFFRDTQGALRDTIFPDLIILSSQTGIRFSLFTAGAEQGPDYWNKEAKKYRVSMYPSGDGIKGIVTVNGFKRVDNEDFLNRSLVTGLGLVHHTADMKDAFNTDPENDWRLLSKDFASGLYALSSFYPWLDKHNYVDMLNATDSYYALKPRIMVTEDELNIHCSGFKQRAVFIARLKYDMELKSTHGAEVTKLEDGIYKVQLSVPDVTLRIVKQVVR